MMGKLPKAIALQKITQKLPANPDISVNFTLALTAEERNRSRYRYDIEGNIINLYLPRGTILNNGDILTSEDGNLIIRIIAKPEPVFTVTANTFLDLIKAAYHLGNRHIPLEITTDYLRLSPDSVLRSMLEKLGLQVQEEIAPFQPELGAYKHGE